MNTYRGIIGQLSSQDCELPEGSKSFVFVFLASLTYLALHLVLGRVAKLYLRN